MFAGHTNVVSVALASAVGAAGASARASTYAVTPLRTDQGAARARIAEKADAVVGAGAHTTACAGEKPPIKCSGGTGVLARSTSISGTATATTNIGALASSRACIAGFREACARAQLIAVLAPEARGAL